MAFDNTSKNVELLLKLGWPTKAIATRLRIAESRVTDIVGQMNLREAPKYVNKAQREAAESPVGRDFAAGLTVEQIAAKRRLPKSKVYAIGAVIENLPRVPLRGEQ